LTLQTYIWPYSIAIVIFLAIDAVWLSTAGRTFYVAEIGSIMRPSPNLAVAFLFYLLFVAGLCFFAIVPSLEANTTLLKAALTGAFFGLVAYATYDLTNLATLKAFTVKVALVDMVWGALLSGVVTGLTLMVLRRWT
jgi:uncharacterized membrane protein